MHPAVTMTPEERDDMLSKTIPMRFASYSRDGPPHVVPVWHAHIDDSIYFDTDGESVKIRNVRDTGMAAGVVDGGESYADLHGVLVQGEARIADDETRRRVLQHNTDKWFDGEVPDFVEQRNQDVERVAVELKMDHVTTWDFSKVFGGSQD